MSRLRITLHGSLLLASDEAGGLGVDAATARRRIAGVEVPYIPATALRGAIRQQLEALLRGADLPATSPYFGDEPEPKEPKPADLAATLFGYSGPSHERTGSHAGKVRISDALPESPAVAALRLGARAGVAIDPATAGAADKKLFFRQVVEAAREPLVFLAELETTPLTPEEDRALRAAVATTRAIGGARSAGSGAVEIEWIEGEPSARTRIEGDPETATRARVEIRLVEPCHFGDGGPLGNYQATRTYIPGSTLRGALGWALVRAGQKEDDDFRALFFGEVSFGEALWTPDPTFEPRVTPVTTFWDVVGDRAFDRLAGELARERVNAELAGSGRHLAVDRASLRLEPVEAPRPSAGLVKLTRTRVSIDRASGTAAATRLFSIEQLEPFSTAGKPTTFVAWIEGLDPARAAAARLLAKLADQRVYLGSGRHHGFGLVELTVSFVAGPPDVSAARSALATFERDVTNEEAAAARLGGLSASERNTVPLALVATSDYLPSSPDHHPLLEIDPSFPAPRRAFIEADLAGGYDEHPNRASALRDLAPALAAGSVFVYELAPERLDSALPALLAAFRRGIGRSIRAGHGRFNLFTASSEAERPALSQENPAMRSHLSPELKRKLVTRAEEVADKADHLQAREVSQLRNLVQVAQQESEVAVLVNFIRYQAARKATEKFWQSLHPSVCAALEEFGAHPDLVDLPERRRVAFQHFFGYLVRAYLYRARRPAPDRQGAPRPGGPR